ncbi:hypothetical protein VTI74DRAFT_7364 [Chaetomium olivicolor]
MELQLPDVEHLVSESAMTYAPPPAQTRVLRRWMSVTLLIRSRPRVGTLGDSQFGSDHVRPAPAVTSGARNGGRIFQRLRTRQKLHVIGLSGAPTSLLCTVKNTTVAFFTPNNMFASVRRIPYNPTLSDQKPGACACYCCFCDCLTSSGSLPDSA